MCLQPLCVAPEAVQWELRRARRTKQTHVTITGAYKTPLSLELQTAKVDQNLHTKPNWLRVFLTSLNPCFSLKGFFFSPYYSMSGCAECDLHHQWTVGLFCSLLLFSSFLNFKMCGSGKSLKLTVRVFCRKWVPLGLLAISSFCTFFTANLGY